MKEKTNEETPKGHRWKTLVIPSRKDLPPRIVLSGSPKIGKTTFCSEFPSAVFLPIKGEQGIDQIDTNAFPTCEGFQDIIHYLKVLIEEDTGFKTVVIDSISALERLVWQAVCADNGQESIEKVLDGYGKGYIEATNYWARILTALDILRERKKVTSILICHTQIKTSNDPTERSHDKWEIDLQKNARALIERWCDCQLFAHRKPLVRRDRNNKDDERLIGSINVAEPVLYTRPTAAYPAGGRGEYGHLPPQMPLKASAFLHAVKEAREKTNKKN